MSIRHTFKTPFVYVETLAHRVLLEFAVEWPLLKQRFLVLVVGLLMQYVHGLMAQLAHRRHHPSAEPLPDIGFDLLPELGPEQHWVSEATFGCAFACFLVWTFTPFVLQGTQFYTVVLWTRLLVTIVVCQLLRIASFSATSLPGPSFHCRAGQATAVRAWPEHWWQHLVLDVEQQVSKGCGDLIFSSHTIFLLAGVLCYNENGSLAGVKALSWLFCVLNSLLIIASRKHYTVDVVIAWYTVPLVFYAVHRRWSIGRHTSRLQVWPKHEDVACSVAVTIDAPHQQVKDLKH